MNNEINLDNEIWTDINDMNYQVSTKKRVRRKHDGYILKPTIRPFTLEYTLFKNYQKKRYYIPKDINVIENLENETWTIIEDFPRYQQSNLGRIKSSELYKGEYLLKPRKSSFGLEYTLYKDGQLIKYYIELKPPVKDLDGEIWKNIIGYEHHYAVSNLGRIKSLDRINPLGERVRERILSPATTEDGYLQVSLSMNGIQKSYLVARLVAFAFVPNPNPEKFIEANHLGKKTDNRACMLEWIDSRGNKLHAWETGRVKARKGEECGCVKLNNEQILEIRELYLTGNFVYRELANIYNVSISTIWGIVRRKNWTHI
mgnify:CR=1 FL=1